MGDMSGQLPSSDSSATITQTAQTWSPVELFCPHPLLRARYFQHKPKTIRSFGLKSTTASPSGPLYSTTAIRTTYNQPMPIIPNNEFHSLVLSLIRLWRDVQPRDYTRYAIALRPIVFKIFDLYLRNEFELSFDELIQVRRLGRAVLEHCKEDGSTSGSGAHVSADQLADRLSEQHTRAGMPVDRSTSVPRPGRSAYSSSDAIHAWMRAM